MKNSLKCFILSIAILGFAINAYPENSLNIPDSPESFMSNTWDEANWTEIDVNRDGRIVEWSISYTWRTDNYPGDASFYVISPSGTYHFIAAGEVAGRYSKTFTSFYGEPANGKWRFWIQDSYSDGGCQAVNISMTIQTLEKYLILTIPESASEGMGQLTGTVIAFPPPNEDMTIALNSSHPDRVNIQSTLNIPAGKESIPFGFSIIDDAIINGRTNVKIAAFMPDYFSGWAAIIIDDNETAALSIILPESANEMDFFVEGKMRIDPPPDVYIEIPVISDDISILTTPGLITLPAGVTETTFLLRINRFNIEKSVLVTTSIPNWQNNSDSIHMIPSKIPEIERNALIDLYNSTDGFLWVHKLNWLQEPGTECSWYGVYCDDNESTVLGIILNYNLLKGSLPESFGNFQNLSHLELYSNQLNSLPESFGSLQNLACLKMSSNQLTSLPEHFVNLQNLSHLDLSYNYLSSLSESFGNDIARR